MKTGKLKPISYSAGYFSSQAITLEEVIAKTLEVSKDKQSIETFSSEEIQNLANKLISQINTVSKYNQISDQRIYVRSNSFFNKDEAEALRQQNRNRIKETKKEINEVISKLETELKDISYFLDYEEDNIDSVAVMDYFFPGQHIPGKASYSQYQELKNFVKKINSIEGEIKLNKYKKKIGESALDLDIEFQEEITKTYNYLFSKIQTLTGLPPNVVQNVVKNESFSSFGFEDDILYFLKKDIREYKLLGLKKVSNSPIRIKLPSKAKAIKSFDLYLDALTLFLELQDNEGTISKKNISPKIGLMILLEEAKNQKTALEYADKIASEQDSKRQENEKIITGEKPVTVKAGTSEKAFILSAESYFNKCFSCFKDAWESDGNFFNDFKFNLSLEFDIKELLDSIDANLSNIKFSSDLPFYIQQNFCSLMRLGSLCPNEIAAIIAGIYSIIIFTWQELCNTRLDFLSELGINFIIKPILGALKTGINFTIAPLDIYMDCVTKTIDDLRKIESADSQYGYGADSLYRALFTPAQQGTYSPAEKGTADSRLNLTSEEKEIIILKISQLNSPTNDNKFYSVITNPALPKGLIDAMEIPKAIASDTIAKVNALSDTISIFLKNIENLLNSASANRIEVSGKVLGLTAMLTLLDGIFQIASKGLEPCIPMPLADGSDPGEVKKTLESPFTLEELALMAKIDNIKYQDNVIDKNNPGLNNSSQSSKGAYLYNPISDKRFNLTNCDKAKSSIISKGESLEFWKRIAMGADIDNV